MAYTCPQTKLYYSRSFPSVTILKVLNEEEEVTVFRGSAEDEEWNLIRFRGPGELIMFHR